MSLVWPVVLYRRRHVFEGGADNSNCVLASRPDTRLRCVLRMFTIFLVYADACKPSTLQRRNLTSTITRACCKWPYERDWGTNGATQRAGAAMQCRVRYHNATPILDSDDYDYKTGRVKAITRKCRQPDEGGRAIDKTI